MRRRAFPPSGDVGCRIPFRRDRQTRSGCWLFCPLESFGIGWRGSAFGFWSWFAFTAIERRSAFNLFECGDVPFLHLAMSAVGYLSVETAKPDRDVGCSARWKALVSAGAGPLLASGLGSLSLPSSAVRHSIYLNAETCLSSIWRCRLTDMSPSRAPTPAEVKIDKVFIHDHCRNGIV